MGHTGFRGPDGQKCNDNEQHDIGQMAAILIKTTLANLLFAGRSMDPVILGKARTMIVSHHCEDCDDDDDQHIFP